jgi:hypothetical protein
MMEPAQLPPGSMAALDQLHAAGRELLEPMLIVTRMLIANYGATAATALLINDMDTWEPNAIGLKSMLAFALVELAQRPDGAL